MHYPLTRERLRALTVMLLVVALQLTACGNDQDAEAQRYNTGEPLEDSTLAVVVTSEEGGDTLTTAEFNQQMQQAMNRMPPTQNQEDRMQDLERRIAEGFVLNYLVENEMDRLDIEADTAEVSARIEQQIAMYRRQSGGEEAFQQQLQTMGMTIDSLRAALRPQIRQQLRQQEYQERLVAEAQDPTEEEVGQYAEEQREDEIRAQHILFTVPDDATEQQEDSVRSFAETVLDSARTADVEFSELAERHSEGPSAPRGGDLGWFGAGQMVPEFEEAAFALSDSGAVAPDLVETQFGYHIIRLTGQRRSPAMDTTQARQALTRERQRESIESALDELRAQATVRLNPDVVEADLNAEPEEPAVGQ